jgi:hypothetical protein
MAVTTFPEQPGPVARAVGSVLFGIGLQLFLRRRFNRDDELELEHPKWIMGDYPRTEQLLNVALRVAAEIPDDAHAVAAIRAEGGKPREWKIAAAWMRQHNYTWENRNRLRAARLLKAVADGGQPVPPTAEQESLFRAVEAIEAVPLAQAYAMLAAEAPALSTLEHQVAASLREPEWQNRNADDRRQEISGQVAQAVGPDVLSGSLLIRSHAAYHHACGYLLRHAGLLEEDNWGR